MLLVTQSENTIIISMRSLQQQYEDNAKELGDDDKKDWLQGLELIKCYDGKGSSDTGEVSNSI